MTSKVKPSKVEGHTKGKWTYNKTATPDWAKQYSVYDETTGKDIALVYHGEQAEEHAALIAQAPETAAERDRLNEVNAILLEALKQGEKVFRKVSQPDEEIAWLSQARQAIKAEGRAE